MADPVIRISIGDDISPLLANVEEKIAAAINKVVRSTADTAFKRILFRTPRDSGKLAAGWRRTDLNGETIFTNSVAYANVLEYGGYPVIPARYARKSSGGLRRGKAILGGGYPPGPRTVPAPSGSPAMLQDSNVSRQAPQGMTRQVLAEIQAEYVFNLEEALDKVLNGEAP